jgi:hypothetical protein
MVLKHFKSAINHSYKLSFAIMRLENQKKFFLLTIWLVCCRLFRRCLSVVNRNLLLPPYIVVLRPFSLSHPPTLSSYTWESELDGWMAKKIFCCSCYIIMCVAVCIYLCMLRLMALRLKWFLWLFVDWSNGSKSF